VRAEVTVGVGKRALGSGGSAFALFFRGFVLFGRGPAGPGMAFSRFLAGFPLFFWGEFISLRAALTPGTVVALRRGYVQWVAGGGVSCRTSDCDNSFFPQSSSWAQAVGSVDSGLLSDFQIVSRPRRITRGTGSGGAGRSRSSRDVYPLPFLYPFWWTAFCARRQSRGAAVDRYWTFSSLICHPGALSLLVSGTGFDYTVTG